jgi:hydroxymethylbilane synthase
MAAELYSPDGAVRITGEAVFTPGDHAPVATLAADLLARSPEGITVLFHGPSA